MKHPAKKQRYDYTLLVVVLLLVGIGLILLYSTSAYNGRVKFHDSFYYLKKQGFATALGLAGMFIVAGIDYHRWIPFAKLGYVTAIVLSVAVMFIGDEYNGSKRWLSLGPISFQPSEFAKVAVILYLSCVISNQARKMEKFTTLVKVMLPVLPVVGLVGASNLSTAIIVLGITCSMIFVVHPKTAPFVVLITAGVAAVFAGVWFIMEFMSDSSNFRIRRLLVWLQPTSITTVALANIRNWATSLTTVPTATTPSRGRSLRPSSMPSMIIASPAWPIKWGKRR